MNYDINIKIYHLEDGKVYENIQRSCDVLLTNHVSNINTGVQHIALVFRVGLTIVQINKTANIQRIDVIFKMYKNVSQSSLL